MELRQLKYFLTVADARSFVSAANDLYLSRQAVSKAVAQLETELGVELFVRDSNGAFLTPAGLMFYDRIRSSVMELELVRTEMQRYGARFHQRDNVGSLICQRLKGRTDYMILRGSTRNANDYSASIWIPIWRTESRECGNNHNTARVGHLSRVVFAVLG